MLFKFTTLVLAVASLAVASPLEGRDVGTCEDAQPTTCTFVVNPSGTPNTEVPLWSEWNYLIGRNLAEDVNTLKGEYKTICGDGTIEVTGPASNGRFTVKNNVGAAGVTSSQAATLLRAWTGRTLAGPWSGVNWVVQSFTCA